MKISNQFKFYN